MNFEKGNLTMQLCMPPNINLQVIYLDQGHEQSVSNVPTSFIPASSASLDTLGPVTH